MVRERHDLLSTSTRHSAIDDTPHSDTKVAADNKAQDLSIDSIYEKMMKIWLAEPITLSGILNALDGILEIQGSVIILTTNHPEKLDPAIIRHGRITCAIEMRAMHTVYAEQLVTSYFNEPAGNIHDDVITPADLTAFCQMAESIGELRNMIDNYQKSKEDSINISR